MTSRMILSGTAEPRRASGERKLMTRSRYQSGSLTLRGGRNKVWVARWREDVLGMDGKVQRVRRSLVLGTLAKIRTRRQARLLLDTKLCDLNAGRRQPQSAMPFRNFIEEVWQPAILPTMKFSTQKLYPHLLRRHLLPVFGDQPLGDIRRVDIQRLVTEKMTRQGLSWHSRSSSQFDEWHARESSRMGLPGGKSWPANQNAPSAASAQNDRFES